ncbi:MAG: hypothetical protein LBT67_00145 [Holosporaceae bacterium]|jgi:hypothetical protein|nr:hypothetical protein [Holosporaceae bacterium]
MAAYYNSERYIDPYNGYSGWSVEAVSVFCKNDYDSSVNSRLIDFLNDSKSCWTNWSAAAKSRARDLLEEIVDSNEEFLEIPLEDGYSLSDKLRDIILDIDSDLQMP